MNAAQMQRGAHCATVPLLRLGVWGYCAHTPHGETDDESSAESQAESPN